MGGDEPRSNRWNADEYDENHAFVADFGTDVVELLAPEADERILDLGCGTGQLTDRIAASGATAVGVDRAAEMIERARAAYPEPRFVRADARRLPFAASFDAVFSNAALHWIPDADQDQLLSAIRASLRPGGRFVAELGGAGNVGRIVEAVTTELEARGYEAEIPWYFPGVGEYAARLEARGFEVRDAHLFDRPTVLDDGEAGLRNWLGMFADGLFEPLPPDERRAVIAAVEERLEPSLYDADDRTWTADYRRLRIRAVAV